MAGKQADTVAGSSVGPRSIHMTQELMEEIQKYPVLYDKFSSDFKDKYKKQNA